MMKNKVAVLGLAALLATAAIAQTGRMRLEGRLAGSAKGKAKWQTRDTASQLQAELEIEGERLTPGATYMVLIGSNLPYSVTANSLGRFTFNQRFNSANRPSIEVDNVVVVTTDTGTTVMSGVMKRR